MPVEATLEHLVGLQAQAPLAPYVGLWSRLAGFDADERWPAPSIDRRAVRISLMRSTIHLVTADDALRLRPFVQPVLERVFRGSSFARDLAGLDLAEVLAAGRSLLAAEPRTRAALGPVLAARFPGYPPDALVYAEHVHRAARPRAATRRMGHDRPGGLDDDRDVAGPARSTSRPTRPRSSLRYLAAFGPATAADMRAWSGVTRLQPVLETLRPQLRHVPRRRGARAVRPARRTAAGPGRARAGPLPARVRQRVDRPRRSVADHPRRPADPAPAGQRRQPRARSCSTGCTPGRGGSPATARPPDADDRRHSRPCPSADRARARDRGRRAARVRGRRLRARDRRPDANPWQVRRLPTGDRRDLPGTSGKSRGPDVRHARARADGPRTRHGAGRDVERAPPLAGRGAVVRRDHRAARGQPGDGRDRRRGRRMRTRTSASSRRARRTTCSTRAGRTIRTSRSSSSSAGQPGATSDPAFQDGRRRSHGRSSRRPARRSMASRRRPSTSWATRSRRRRRPASCRPTGRPSGSSAGSRATTPGSRRSSRPSCRSWPTARAASPALRDPRDQQHVHQRRHQRPHLRGPRRVAPADDPADVPDPAVRLRGDRRLGRAAGPGDHVARRGVRDPRHLQPGWSVRSAPTRRS